VNTKALTLTTLGACLITGGYMSMNNPVFSESAYAGTVEGKTLEKARVLYLYCF
jgi:hypothetical protein